MLKIKSYSIIFLLIFQLNSFDKFLPVKFKKLNFKSFWFATSLTGLTYIQKKYEKTQKIEPKDTIEKKDHLKDNCFVCQYIERHGSLPFPN